MGKEEIVLCDSNIVIAFLRGDFTIKKQLKDIGHENIALSIITHSEVLVGAKKADFNGVKDFF